MFCGRITSYWENKKPLGIQHADFFHELMNSNLWIYLYLAITFSWVWGKGCIVDGVPIPSLSLRKQHAFCGVCGPNSAALLIMCTLYEINKLKYWTFQRGKMQLFKAICRPEHWQTAASYLTHTHKHTAPLTDRQNSKRKEGKLTILARVPAILLITLCAPRSRLSSFSTLSSLSYI